jgi:putative membrane protein
MTAALLAFLHHGAAFVIFGVLTAELLLLKGEITPASARSLLRIDAAYGMSAMTLIVVGFVRVFYTEKGAAYYFHSAPFIAKIALFAAVGLLSIYPTRQFLSWRKTLRQQQAPVLEDGKRRSIRLILHTELTLLLVIMLCAALMARGIGYVG